MPLDTLATQLYAHSAVRVRSKGLLWARPEQRWAALKRMEIARVGLRSARFWPLLVMDREGVPEFVGPGAATSTRIHRNEDRIEAHIIVAFLAYCLQVTLKVNLRPLAGGLTPREVIAKFKAMQMVGACIPTTDGRELI